MSYSGITRSPKIFALAILPILFLSVDVLFDFSVLPDVFILFSS